LWVMQQIEQQNKGAGIPRKMMMSWSEVKELHEAGFYIGSHSHTYPMLASLAGEEELFNELSVLQKKFNSNSAKNHSLFLTRSGAMIKE